MSISTDLYQHSHFSATNVTSESRYALDSLGEVGNVGVAPICHINGWIGRLALQVEESAPQEFNRGAAQECGVDINNPQGPMLR